MSGRLPDHLPKMQEKFDVILLLDVLEHISFDQKSLQVIKGLLKPNGILLINVPALPILWSRHDIVTEHKRRYTKKKIDNLLCKAGYLTHSSTYWSHFLVPYLFIERTIFDKHAHKKRYEIPPAHINSFMQYLLYFEFLICRKLSVPFGSSLVVVASKK
jgi:SAM-dependent methyltransferase